MRKPSLARAFSLVVQTKQFLPLRLGLVLVRGLTLALSVLFGMAAEAYLLPPGLLGSLAGVPGVLVGLGVWLAVLGAASGLVLGRVELPHLAAIAARIEDVEAVGAPSEVVPAQIGPTRIGPAKALVRARFGRGRDVARLSRLVRSLVRGIAALVDEGVDADQVGPAMDLRARWMRLYRRLSAGPVSEVVLGHALRRGDENGWDGAHDASVLLAQNSGRMLAVAGRLVLTGWLLTAILFLVAFEPLAALLPAQSGTGAVPVVAAVLALILSWGIKAAVIDPVILSCLLLLFLETTEGQHPNAEWRGLLAHALPAFRKLATGAEGWRPAPSDLALNDA